MRWVKVEDKVVILMSNSVFFVCGGFLTSDVDVWQRANSCMSTSYSMCVQLICQLLSSSALTTCSKMSGHRSAICCRTWLAYSWSSAPSLSHSANSASNWERERKKEWRDFRHFVHQHLMIQPTLHVMLLCSRWLTFWEIHLFTFLLRVKLVETDETLMPSLYGKYKAGARC